MLPPAESTVANALAISTLRRIRLLRDTRLCPKIKFLPLHGSVGVGGFCLAVPKAPVTATPARSIRSAVADYVLHLQSMGAVVGYLRVHRGQRFASTAAVTADDGSVSSQLVAFQKWQRKDDITHKYLRRFTQCEGVLYVGDSGLRFEPIEAS
jgi:hypothetical protein